MVMSVLGSLAEEPEALLNTPARLRKSRNSKLGTVLLDQMIDEQAEGY